MIGRLTILQLVSALTFSLISHKLNMIPIFLFVSTSFCSTQSYPSLW